MKKHKALFLDRDGIINKLVKYSYGYDSPQSLKNIVINNQTIKIVRWANKYNLLVIEISNQPGVAKGKMTQETSDAIEVQIHKLLALENARVDKSYICSHHPKAKAQSLAKMCKCRKPKPGLLLQAARELNIDLKKSVFLGDKATDVEAGRAAGCKTIIFLHGDDVAEKVNASEKAKADYKVADLQKVIPILIEIFGI